MNRSLTFKVAWWTGGKTYRWPTLLHLPHGHWLCWWKLGVKINYECVSHEEALIAAHNQRVEVRRRERNARRKGRT